MTFRHHTCSAATFVDGAFSNSPSKKHIKLEAFQRLQKKDFLRFKAGNPNTVVREGIPAQLLLPYNCK